MSHYVTLLFDVEDLCWPGSDDIPLDLAGILTRNQVKGTFFVVGEKARLGRAAGASRAAGRPAAAGDRRCDRRPGARRDHALAHPRPEYRP